AVLGGRREIDVLRRARPVLELRVVRAGAARGVELAGGDERRDPREPRRSLPRDCLAGLDVVRCGQRSVVTLRAHGDGDVRARRLLPASACAQHEERSIGERARVQARAIGMPAGRPAVRDGPLRPVRPAGVRFAAMWSRTASAAATYSSLPTRRPWRRSAYAYGAPLT